MSPHDSSSLSAGSAARSAARSANQPVALVLTGGGARAAYQVGVLQAIARIRRAAGERGTGNPFPIITGTSAGAINGAALACGADDFTGTVRAIAAVWHDLHAAQIYRTDAFAMLDAAARWRLILGIGQLVARWFRLRPRALLDNGPLAELLARMVPFERLAQMLDHGHIEALAVSASSYRGGKHVTFYESRAPIASWSRAQRIAVAARIERAHLMASSAIPFVFAATPLVREGQIEYFGDGSMRQTSPLSAAVHLGAERILAVGSGRIGEPESTDSPTAMAGDPTLAQIAGHALSAIFLDALAADVERMERVNATLALIPPEARGQTTLRPIELLTLAPSTAVDAIAARHTHVLPKAIKRLLASGTIASDVASDVKSAALASYLMFEPGFIRELMALGRADTLARKDEVMQFFGWAAR